MKSFIITIFFAAACLSLAGCNTVKGAFQGAGQDTKALANQLQLNDAPSHKSSGSTHQYNKVTTTPSRVVAPASTVSSPDAQ